jgi:hypothetical protein
VGEGVADVGWSATERVTNANGKWPFRLSGMPTTQHSAMDGCEEMACSMVPVRRGLVGPVKDGTVGSHVKLVEIANIERNVAR